MPVTSSHILSLFPSLFSYSALAPFFLRLALGLLFIYVAYAGVRYSGEVRQKMLGWLAWPLTIVNAVIGVLILIGLYTQGAALAAVVITLLGLWHHRHNRERRVILLLALAIAIAILFLGAGALAFDLPV